MQPSPRIPCLKGWAAFNPVHREQRTAGSRRRGPPWRVVERRGPSILAPLRSPARRSIQYRRCSNQGPFSQAWDEDDRYGAKGSTSSFRPLPTRKKSHHRFRETLEVRVVEVQLKVGPCGHSQAAQALVERERETENEDEDGRCRLCDAWQTDSRDTRETRKRDGVSNCYGAEGLIAMAKPPPMSPFFGSAVALF